jgi:hypothetical protein
MRQCSSKLVGDAPRSAFSDSITPPSESKAALTFLRATTGQVKAQQGDFRERPEAYKRRVVGV